MLAKLKVIPSITKEIFGILDLDPYMPISAPIDPATGRNLADRSNKIFPDCVLGLYCSLKRKVDNLELFFGRVQASK